MDMKLASMLQSKLRSPSRTKFHQQAMKNPTGFQPTTSKEEKKLTSTTTSKSQDIEAGTMYTKSEEPAVQLKVSITKKDVKEGNGKNLRTEEPEEETAKEIEGSNANHSSTNGKEMVELRETENTTPREEIVTTELIVDKSGNEESNVEDGKRENGDNLSEALKNEAEKEETEAAGSESEESSLKLVDEPEVPKSSDENLPFEFTTNGEKTEKNENVETAAKDETKATEHSSNEVVESTTCETPDNGNSTQSDKETEPTEQPKANPNVEDVSFVSYDSSIMLKDVQIKLNDCLKDNSKLFEVSNVEDSVSEEPQKRADMSFGKTLRNISGRTTINRLRYVTVRENRFSPNSSLFVNTSSASLDPDDPTSSKLSRYPTELSDSILCNSSPAERKRKMVENSGASSKKLKTESSSSLFNTSLEILKGLRRPVEVSTPRPQGYKFETDKLSFKSFSDDKLTADAEVEPKKWCVIM